MELSEIGGSMPEGPNDEDDIISKSIMTSSSRTLLVPFKYGYRVHIYGI